MEKRELLEERFGEVVEGEDEQKEIEVKGWPQD